MPTSWGSAQVGLSGLIRQASCSVAVQLLVQLSRTVMRSQFVVLMASLGLGSWPDSSRLRTYPASTTVSIPTSGRAGSGLDQAFHTTAVDMRACGRRSCHSSIRRRPGRTEHCPMASLDPGWEDTPVRVPANGERAADPSARRQPVSSHGDDAAAGRARVRGLAGRGDAQRIRGAVLAHEGNVGR
jgi:hypothetical protein